MARQTRRNFLKTSAVFGASFVIAGTKASGKVIGANDTIRIGVAGLNGRGGSHVGEFSQMKNVQITYLIDPHTKTYAKHQATIKSRGGNEPKCVQDVREALDDKNLDAISIATPNHWHALMTIMACQAGKDVYVEKPCSHNIHEGRIAVEMARKNGCIVQHGTQSRSSGSWAKLAEIAKSGKLGKLLVSRGLCYKDGGTGGNTRGNIGFKEPGPPPAELDFNLWLGPAKEQPYHANLVHYRWHWFWDFGNGDIGNQGVHEIDKARWVIPGATLPKSVFCVGGRFGGPDQAEAANTQVAVFDYGETQLIFEVRGLPSEKYHGEGVGNVLHFEEGIVAGDKFYPKGKDKPESLPAVDVEVKRGPGGSHFGNFIAAMRSRKQEDLNADILQGHYSAALCHLANISYRLGEQVSFDGKKLGTDDPATVDGFDRMVDHLRSAGQKLDGQTYSLGRRLKFDPQAEKFINDSQADALLTRNYRKPFVVPEKVS